MARRQREKKLHKELTVSKFQFIPKGKYHLTEIYANVKNQYENLCDDNFKCFDCCKSGGKDPEWHHIVRGQINSQTKKISHIKRLGYNQYEIY